METPNHLSYPSDIKYLATHQWACCEEDGCVSVGITDYAQQQLGDVVFIDLPEVGAELAQGEEAGVIESVKAASDLFSPLSGTVIAVNSQLEDCPDLVNASPYGDGWLFKIRPTELEHEWEELLDADAYVDAVALEQNDE